MNRIESDLTGKDKTASLARASVAFMSAIDTQYSAPDLWRAHAMACAVDLWVRHRSMHAKSINDSLSGPGRRAFAGGLIVGLSKLFVLDDRETELVAYVYSLMDGAADDALRLAARLLAAGQEPVMQRGFLQGLEEAGKLVGQLGGSNNADGAR